MSLSIKWKFSTLKIDFATEKFWQWWMMNFFLVANILIANISSNSVIVITFYQQPGQFSQVGTWSRSGKEIHVALNITDGLPTETLRLKNSSPLIVKTRLVSCYGVLKATTLMLGQVMWGSHFVLKYLQFDCFVLWHSRQKLISHEPNSVCWLPNAMILKKTEIFSTRFMLLIRSIEKTWKGLWF